MSTLRINNIEAKSVPASPTLDEKVKITNSTGDVLVHVDGKTSGITTIGINTTASNITFDANSNVKLSGIVTATSFSGSGANLTNISGANITGTIPQAALTNATVDLSGIRRDIALLSLQIAVDTNRTIYNLPPNNLVSKIIPVPIVYVTSETYYGG